MPEHSRFESFITRQEEENETACLKCARANGYTREQAEQCESGHLDCDGCPWGGKE